MFLNKHEDELQQNDYVSNFMLVDVQYKQLRRPC